MPSTPAPLGLLCPLAAPGRTAATAVAADTALVLPAGPAAAPGARGARGSGRLPTGEGTARATILVADVRGFTGISRRLGAAATAAFLNRLFGAIVPCIETEAGSIDKFIGDAVLAVFGLPFAGGDEADRAVRAAIAIQRTIHDLNRTAPDAAGTAIAIAIGIDAGEVFFGRVGAAPYAAPTVIGASVNAAFALQEACKLSGAGILISAAVRPALAGRYCLRLIEAPGANRPLPDEPGQNGDRGGAAVYEVLDHCREATFPAPRAAEMTNLCNATKRLGVRRRVRL